MKLIVLGIMALLSVLNVGSPVFAEDVSVRGHLRSDGTYVQPHIRSAPDSGTRQPRLYDGGSSGRGQGGLTPGYGRQPRGRW